VEHVPELAQVEPALRRLEAVAKQVRRAPLETQRRTARTVGLQRGHQALAPRGVLSESTCGRHLSRATTKGAASDTRRAGCLRRPRRGEKRVQRRGPPAAAAPAPAPAARGCPAMLAAPAGAAKLAALAARAPLGQSPRE